MLNIRSATPNDIPEILKFIHELAESWRSRGCLWARRLDFRSNLQDLL